MIRELPWDSQHFACRIGRVDGDAPQTDPAFDCLYFLGGAGDRRAIEAGFVEMGERVCLTAGDLAAATSSGLRPARPGEGQRLASIEFPDSRFSRDPHFARERVSAMYRVWVDNLIESTFVAEADDSLAGYVACSAEAERVRLSLMGVAPRFRGCGIGGRLVNAAKEFALQRGAAELSVITQGSNEAALHLYQRHGFRETARATWYHWWRP